VNGGQSGSVKAAGLTSSRSGRSAVGAWLDLLPWLLLGLLIAAVFFLLGIAAARRRRTAVSPA
jgi:hypothetical protein